MLSEGPPPVRIASRDSGWMYQPSLSARVRQFWCSVRFSDLSLERWLGLVGTAGSGSGEELRLSTGV